MKTRAVILAGGEGSRLGVLTIKRTKPAVPFAGKYRIIDFTLSNCANSGIFDVMILAQYRPHSLIEHIGAGAPWDMNRDFTGGVRIYTPYTARRHTDWYLGNADAVQQNFSFIRSTKPDLVLILSGDHIYQMNYDALVAFHIDHQADMTMATIRVPMEEASRFGIVSVSDQFKVTSFIEKPDSPESNLINMGVYVFNLDVLDEALWDDYQQADTTHDFGKDILPRLIKNDARVFAYPYTGYWVDVGTIDTYWQAHMDLLSENPPLDLDDRSWIVHTRTEERPPMRTASGADICESMVTDGCSISTNAKITRSVLGPGVRIGPGASIRDSIILTDCVIAEGAVVERAIIDKRVTIGESACVGCGEPSEPLVMIGKNSVLPPGILVEPGAIINADVIETDFPSTHIQSDQIIEKTRRIRHDL
jgi:glucose-1-phosphate adenylyltransferase